MPWYRSNFWFAYALKKMWEYNMDEIVVALMSGPKDGDIITISTLLDSDDPVEMTIGRREGCDVCLSYDSQVSRDEFRGPEEHFDRFDRNSDGYIDEDEAPNRPPPNQQGQGGGSRGGPWS